MKYFVTGYTGFVGPHLVKLLLELGHDVIVALRDPEKGRDADAFLKDIDTTNLVHIRVPDLREKDILSDVFKSHKFDGIFHLAGFTHPPSSFLYPAECFSVNALGSICLFDSISKYSPETMVMQCSTPEVYGIQKGMIRTETALAPMNPYGVSKAATDLYMLERIRSKTLRGFITRAFSHTGPRRPAKYAIASDAVQIARILDGKQAPVIRVGNLDAQRAVLDVRDVVATYYMLMCKHKEPYGIVQDGDVHIFGGREVRRIGWYLDRMLELFDLTGKVTIEVDPGLLRPIDIPVQRPDNSDMELQFRWTPCISIDKTLTDLVNY